jgi:sec-independent protein translocase protein TatB
MFPEGRALEFLLAAVIALVVVGPKDLPVLMRKLGQFIGKMRAMAAEFRASFDEMARQSELDELRKEVEAMRRAQFADVAQRASPEAHEAFTDIRQNLGDVGHELRAPDAPAPYYEAPSEPIAAPEPAAALTPAADAQATPAPKPRAKRATKTAAASPKPPAKPRAKKTAEPGA